MAAVGFDVLVVALASLLIYWLYQKWKLIQGLCFFKNYLMAFNRE